MWQEDREGRCGVVWKANGGGRRCIGQRVAEGLGINQPRREGKRCVCGVGKAGGMVAGRKVCSVQRGSAPPACPP